MGATVGPCAVQRHRDWAACGVEKAAAMAKGVGTLPWTSRWVCRVGVLCVCVWCGRGAGVVWVWVHMWGLCECGVGVLNQDLRSMPLQRPPLAARRTMPATRAVFLVARPAFLAAAVAAAARSLVPL